jgi:hypothetical protein
VAKFGQLLDQEPNLSVGRSQAKIRLNAKPLAAHRGQEKAGINGRLMMWRGLKSTSATTRSKAGMPS